MGLLKIWLRQTRANFLVLSVALVAIGAAAAHSNGCFNFKIFILTIIGVLLSHVSVNLFNEYSDYKTGIDFKTNKTPFSGGSGTLQQGLTKPKTVLLAAIISLLVAFIIGLYLIYQSGWLIIFFMILGAAACAFYTPYFSHWLIGEFFAGLCLGSFVVLGSYYVLAKSLPLNIILISIPPGILTSLLLFLNEFPDAEADKAGGRKHLIIYFGKKTSAKYYLIGLSLVYLSILLPIVFGFVSPKLLVSFLTIPIAVKAVSIVLNNYDNTPTLIPALGLNVIVVLATDFLLAIGFLL